MPQSLYARCPECATVFRVTEQLLKVAKGKVRCGACLHIFKATDHLVRPKSQDSAAQSAAETSSLTEKETSIARSADRLAEAIQASDNPSEASLLTASPVDELEIRHTRKTEETSYPIEQFGKTNSEESLFSKDGMHESADEDLLDQDPDSFNTDEMAAENLDELDHAENDWDKSSSHENQSWDATDADEYELESVDEATERDVAREDHSFDDHLEPSLDDIDAFTEDSEPVDETLENESQVDRPLEEPTNVEPEEVGQLGTELELEAASSDLSLEESDTLQDEPMFEAEVESSASLPVPPVPGLDNHTEAVDDDIEDSEVSIDHLNATLQGDALEPDPLDEFDDIVSEKSHTYKWIALSTLVMIALVWGGVALWKDRQTLAWDDTWGGLVQGMCAALPCDLKPRRDVAAIELIQRDIGPSESNPEITEFSLVIRNNAAFDQPYPVVKIRFTDTRGEVVAEELHQPETYLSEDLATTQMPQGQKVHILIRAQQSYAGAFGFEFSFQ